MRSSKSELKKFLNECFKDALDHINENIEGATKNATINSDEVEMPLEIRIKRKLNSLKRSGNDLHRIIQKMCLSSATDKHIYDWEYVYKRVGYTKNNTDLYFVLKWVDGWDEIDEDEFCDPADPKWRLVGKITVDDSGDTMPWVKNGVVWDNEIVLPSLTKVAENDDFYETFAKWMVETIEELKKLNISPSGEIQNKKI